MEHIVMTVISQSGSDLLHLSTSCVCIKLTVGTSVIDGNFLRLKLIFVLIRWVSVSSDISLKLSQGSHKSIKGLNWFQHKVMGALDANVLTASIIKSCVNMEHFSDMF